MKDIIDRLQLLIETAISKLQAINEDEWSYKPRENKWSKKEIIGHLIDGAANNHHRFIRAQYEDSPLVVYDQNAWVSLSHYLDYNGQQLVSFWVMYNQHLTRLIAGIPEKNLTKTCYIGLDSIVTLEELAKDYVAHMEHHLKQSIEL